MHKNKSYLFAFTSIFCWASIAAVTKLLLVDLDSMQILCISTFLASLTLVIINAVTKKTSILKQYGAKDFTILILIGILGMFFYNFFLYTALVYLPAQEGFIINYLWPIMIVIFAAPILKEKLTAHKITAIGLSFAGIVIVVTKGNFNEIDLSSPLGIIFAVFAAISYGLFSVLVKKYAYDESISMMIFYITAFVISFIAMNLNSSMPSLNTMQWLGLAWNGIFNCALAYTSWALALKYGETDKIANLAFLTPFLSLVYIYFLLAEQISIYSVLGLFVIILSIFIQNFRKR